MAWHMASLEPRAVFDAYDELVCLCKTEKHAELITRTMNEQGVIDAKPQPQKLSAAA